MTIHPMLDTYLDGLDASVDGRGFDAKHEKARDYVETAVSTYQNIKDALGTDEDGDNLVDVARAAHRAEQRSAALERLVGTISRMEKYEPSEEAEIDALVTMNRLIEESCDILKS